MTYPEKIGLETPEADAAEQATSARPEEGDGEEGDGEAGTTLDDEVPEWDAREQQQVVELEDEYR